MLQAWRAPHRCKEALVPLQSRPPGGLREDQQGHRSQIGLGSNLRLISCDLQSHEVMYLRKLAQHLSHERSAAPPLPHIEEARN